MGDSILELSDSRGLGNYSLEESDFIHDPGDALIPSSLPEITKPYFQTTWRWGEKHIRPPGIEKKQFGIAWIKQSQRCPPEDIMEKTSLLTSRPSEKHLNRGTPTTFVHGVNLLWSLEGPQWLVPHLKAVWNSCFLIPAVQADSILDSGMCGNVVVVRYFRQIWHGSFVISPAVLNEMFKLTPPSVLLQGKIVSWDLHPPYARSPTLPHSL